MRSAPRRIMTPRLLLSSVVIAAVFLPTLHAPFDFVDDGNLVYPAPAMELRQRLERVRANIRANYEHLGAFRPVLWAHWEAQADLFGGVARWWRMNRWLWLVLSTLALLGFLLELRVAPAAAIAATAAAIWNPYRAEIWRSLTLAEGVAMPYALLALTCAARGARTGNRHWDVAAALATLAALGCKNTFIALIPAQLVLRLMSAADDRYSRRRAAVILSLPALLPVLHFSFFAMNWHPGQYELSWPPPQHLERWLYGLRQAIGLDFIGIALLLALVAGARPDVSRHPIAAYAGLALLLAGTAVYLPIAGVEPRYTMPAVWGVDIWIALLLNNLWQSRHSTRSRAAITALCLGLLAMAIVNVARQARASARATVLWHAVDYVEQHAAEGATVAWLDGPRLGIGEGIHFFWHLARRGRAQVQPLLLDPSGQVRSRPELISSNEAASIMVSGDENAPAIGRWADPIALSVSYWWGTRRDACFVWVPRDARAR